MATGKRPATPHTRNPGAPPRGIRPRRSRGGGPQLLSRAIERMTKPVFGKRGFAHATIINNWPAIIGGDFARLTAPEKIVFSKNGTSGGILHLRIASGSLATEMQHLEPLIVERINQHFGYKAIQSLRLIQGPIPGAAPVSEPRAAELSPAEARALADSLCNVDDPEIRAALERLGRAVGIRRRSPAGGKKS